jgi:hypothetical protein
MVLLSKFRDDEAGIVASTEIILLMLILVFGLIAGMVSMRDAVSQEVADTGLAVNNINQSYSYAGNTIAGVGTVAGSVFDDNSDINDGADAAGAAPPGLSLASPAGAIE